MYAIRSYYATETAEYTSTYVGESDRNQLGTVFVDTPGS